MTDREMQKWKDNKFEVVDTKAIRKGSRGRVWLTGDLEVCRCEVQCGHQRDR